MKLVRDMLSGQRLALARMISKIENRDPDLPELMRELYPRTGKAQVWGITGPPGAGKSSLVDRLVLLLRKKGKKVAVVAVDPSSPFSGGAILGDRIRMQQHSGDAGVYIRSLGTRGKHGGLSHATKEVVLALDAAGFDLILVETAGVGQTELEILRLAQTIIVVLVPESGDSIQVMKAGLMEIADVFAVNKSDRPAADQLVRELVTMVSMNAPHALSSHSQEHAREDNGRSAAFSALPEAWSQPVLKTQATTEVGIEALLNAAESHQKYLTQSGKRMEKSREFLVNELTDILTERLNHSVEALLEEPAGAKVIQSVIDRTMDPYLAAEKLSKLIFTS